MKEIVLKNLDQSIFSEKLSNGLEVVLIPYSNKNNYYISYTTKYGSVNLNFVPCGEKDMFLSPKGIAHFLEHKMFEQESGEDPFTFFSKTGTGCNAGTSYKKTSYFIYGINDLENNLEYLIDFVNEPYFTDENVEKEKGIIIEEIKMYDDNHDWILTEEVQKATFKNHPIRYDIAGYVDSVSSITKEDLYKCYNTFYQPSNMILVVSGNFDKDKVLNIIKNNKALSQNKILNDIEQEQIKEPEQIFQKLKKIKLDNVSIPKIATNIKISLKNVEDKYQYYLYISAIVSILFGAGSTFREEVLKKGYVNYINCDRMLVDDYLIIEFYAEGTKYKELLEEITNTIKKAKIKSDQLERYKKVLIASTVMESDNVQTLAEVIVEDYITWDKIIDKKVDLIKEMNLKKLEEIKNNIDIDNNATVVIEG